MGRRRGAPELIAREGDLVVLRDRERPSGRLLRQDDMDASYVDLEDPQRLGFDYLDTGAAYRALRCEEPTQLAGPAV